MASERALWWNPERTGVTGDSPVVRHAPDDGQYHLPDPAVAGKLPASSRYGEFVTIPRARRDGASTGFDAQTAGVVHVDPDAPDGGVLVDLAHLSRRDLDAAIASSHWPHQVFYKLGEQPALAAPARASVEASQTARAPERVSPLLAGGYVVPRSLPDGRQYVTPAQERPMRPLSEIAAPHGLTQEDSMLPTDPPRSPLPLPLPHPAQAASAPVVAAPNAYQPQAQQPQAQQPQAYYPPSGDPALYATLEQLTAMMGRLVVRLDNPAPTLAPSAPASPPPEPLSAVVTSVNGRSGHKRSAVFAEDDLVPIGRARRSEPRDSPAREAGAREADEPPREAVAGYKSLKLDFVDGPDPRKPACQVIFDLPGAGRMSPWYHAVVESATCVALVYDTRYESGAQYLPPDLGDTEIALHAPGLRRSFTVSSMGLSFPLGAFDVAVLIKHDATDLVPQGG